jgi:hypothetical protein
MSLLRGQLRSWWALHRNVESSTIRYFSKCYCKASILMSSLLGVVREGQENSEY